MIRKDLTEKVYVPKISEPSLFTVNFDNQLAADIFTSLQKGVVWMIFVTSLSHNTYVPQLERQEI